MKPDNIAFCRNEERNEDNDYELKLIDFGVSASSYDEIISYTEFYFFNERSRI